MSGDLNVAVAVDPAGWYVEIVNAFDRERARGVPVLTTLVDVQTHDWVRNAQGFDAIIWNPSVMGPISTSFFKEKVYALQHLFGLRVMPNFESVWHFESKIAQSYILDKLDVPRPRTVVSFEYEDALRSAEALGLPVVAKKSFGASSENVVLLRTQAALRRYLETAFAQQIWDEHKLERGSAIGAAASAPASTWMREKVRRKVTHAERVGCVYLQEFIAGNDSDYRINVIGRRVAGCRRLNRPNDFRASGSGRIDRLLELPADAVDLCVRTRERIGADCLAFDVLHKDGQPLIVEMSYVEALSSHPVHWVIEPDGTRSRVDGEAWDQELWAKHILDEFGL